MKYCILYSINDYGVKEFYIKGKTVEHIEDRIKTYSNGFLSTNRWTLVTSNVKHGYLREVNEMELLNFSKRQFAIINENQSVTAEELGVI